MTLRLKGKDLRTPEDPSSPREARFHANDPPGPQAFPEPPDSAPRRRDPPETAPRTLRRVHALGAFATLLVYLATMSGHMTSMDGLLMYRQAHALVFDHSVRLRTPAWNWEGKPYSNSQYGIGLSLLYVPGLLFVAPLESRVPLFDQPTRQVATRYFQQLYDDPVYAMGASWVHAVVAAASAWCVARLAVALGAGAAASIWAMALVGLGSATFVYSQGDFAQPLAGLCWAGGLLAALRYRDGHGAVALWAASAIAGYAILARPFEGLLLVPALLLVMLPAPRPGWLLIALRPAFALGVGAATAIAATLLVNVARFDDPLQFGYTSQASWVVPHAATVAAVLVSPGRGLLWQFPAVVLAPLGAAALWRSGQHRAVAAIAGLVLALLVSTTCWHTWWGGWCWGLRLFVPATPLLAVLAGVAVDRLEPATRRWLPAALLLAGVAWVLPCLLTDMLQGLGSLTDGERRVWMPEAFPPYGAWPFLERLHVTRAIDTDGINVVWFRIVHAAGPWTMLVPVALLGAALALVARCRREWKAGGLSSAA